MLTPAMPCESWRRRGERTVAASAGGLDKPRPKRRCSLENLQVYCLNITLRQAAKADSARSAAARPLVMAGKGCPEPSKLHNAAQWFMISNRPPEDDRKP